MKLLHFYFDWILFGGLWEDLSTDKRISMEWAWSPLIVIPIWGNVCTHDDVTVRTDKQSPVL